MITRDTAATTLFAALDVASGKVIGACMDRHRASGVSALPAQPSIAIRQRTSISISSLTIMRRINIRRLRHGWSATLAFPSAASRQLQRHGSIRFEQFFGLISRGSHPTRRDSIASLILRPPSKAISNSITARPKNHSSGAAQTGAKSSKTSLVRNRVLESQHWRNGRRDSQILHRNRAEAQLQSDASAFRHHPRKELVTVGQRRLGVVAIRQQRSDKIIARACFTCFLRSSQLAMESSGAARTRSEPSRSICPPQLPSAR